MERKIKSTIEWQIEDPKETGECLVVLQDGTITFDECCCITNSNGEEDFSWRTYDEDAIIAWYNLNGMDIEYYEE